MAGPAGERNVPGAGGNLLNIALGLGLAILGPLMTRMSGGSWSQMGLWNNIIVGVLIALLAFNGMRSFRPTADWAQVALGFWLILAPLIPNFAYGEEGLESIVVGIAVMFVALLDAALKTTAVRRRTAGV
jgi:hypothetical protein